MTNYYSTPGGKMSNNNIYHSSIPQSGNLCYNMTNDYMFRAVLQKNTKVLKGLIGALLHLDPVSIEVEITIRSSSVNLSKTRI